MRRLQIQLPIDDYRKLQQLSARDERSPDRQAAYLLRQRLARVPVPNDTVDRDLALVGPDRPQPDQAA